MHYMCIQNSSVVIEDYKDNCIDKYCYYLFVNKFWFHSGAWTLGLLGPKIVQRLLSLNIFQYCNSV